MDYALHGILQARILERVAIPFSRGSPQPRVQTQVPRIAGRRFTNWATRENCEKYNMCRNNMDLKVYCLEEPFGP